MLDPGRLWGTIAPRHSIRVQTLHIHKSSFASLLLCLFVNVQAAEVEVGDRTITIPFPEGFVALTPEMSPYYEMMQAYIGPSNVRYLSLIPESAAEALLQGQTVEVRRYINIESEATLSNRSVSSSDFADFKAVLRDQVEQMYDEVEREMPRLMEKGNRELSEQWAADVAIQVGGFVPLPVHLDTERAIASSMYATVRTTVGAEDAGPVVVSATSLFLHARDKVLFLYVYGSKDDVEWTRETAGRLASDIIDSNGPTPGEQRSVSSSDARGIDWGQVLEKGLFGALAGGLIGLLAFLFRRRGNE